MIIQELSYDFPFLSSEMTYTMGWSDGGYLVSYSVPWQAFCAMPPPHPSIGAAAAALV
jgi:hypothetical protein